MSALRWRTVTGSRSAQFMIKGAVLNSALFGPNSRYCAEEIRCYDAENNADRRYVVRDAHLVSDDDMRAGKRSPIIERFADIYQLEAFVRKVGH